MLAGATTLQRGTSSPRRRLCVQHLWVQAPVNEETRGQTRLGQIITRGELLGIELN